MGPYEVLAPLGAGGMGEVYRALDPRLGRDVAIKVVHPRLAADPDRLSRFEKEAHAAAQLDHPNILVVHDVGTHEGSPYIVSELLHGESLREKLGAPLPPKKAVEYAIQIAHGLAAAHEKGIVHRDIKPENVFVTKDGHVKILDFGVAKLLPTFEASGVDTKTPTEIATQPGAALGTVAYMSPEQIRGQPVDARSDLFSLGVVLFEMLSGKRPFQRETAAETMTAILHEEPPSLAGSRTTIPPELERIVSQCLEKQLADRLSSAHDLAIALRNISSDQQPAGRSAESPRPRRRLWLATVVVIAATLAAVGVLKWPRTSAKNTLEEKNWGPPRQITSAPGWDAEPALSPDGTLVAYSSDAAGSSDIWVVDVQGGEPMRLTDGSGEESKPAWFPDGRSVAYASVRGSKKSVWKVARLGGSPSLLVEDADMPAISPDGKRIAFARSGPGGSLRIWTASLDHPADARRLTGDDGGLWDHTDPAWSPDGSRICYSDFRNLWILDVEKGESRQLTPGDASYLEPAWSASEDIVYCSSQRGGINALWVIWRIPLDGGRPVRETSGPGPERHPDFSRDGRLLVYSSAFPDRDILVIDRSLGTTSRIASARSDVTPAIAPDGSGVVYVSDRLGKYDLWLQPMTGGRPSPILPKRLTDLETGPNAPAFSPDGQWVAYFRILNGQRDIWMVPVKGGVPVQVTDHPAQDVHPAFSPDGSRLAFISSRSGREHVWILPIRGASASGEPWQLTEGEQVDMFPSFSPNGELVAFIRGGEIWVTTPKRGASRRQVTTGAGIHYCAWESDGRSLLASGMWGTSILRIRNVHLESGATEPLTPDVPLGSRDAPGYFGLSRDGRYLAVDVVQTKGNLWTIRSPASHS